jgi:hypothetical protein
VYLDGRCWTCDARHNTPRIGRVLMATGRDAADVAITTTFGQTCLQSFQVVSHEVEDRGIRNTDDASSGLEQEAPLVAI